ncbi:MAG: PKD domain-containing protein [Bacteroidota bacterium]
MKRITFILIALFTASIGSAQMADVTIGCDPLTVNFTSPTLDDYYWEFGDGNFSEVKDPEHIYPDPGIYTAELFEGVGGPKIGEVEITVLTPPEVQISASEQLGCSPFQVQFMNESIIDPNAQVTGFFWSFGDGGSSDQENPIHTYTEEGTYSVALKIISSLENCEVTQEFQDFITVSGNVQAGFSIDNTVICDAPATFNITNNTVDMSGYTYSWDFGNEQTSEEYNPPPANYDMDGTYTITLVIDNGEGCVVTLSRNVRVGRPKIDLTVPDTVCIGVPTNFATSTLASSYLWGFGPNAFPETYTSRDTLVSFDESGPQIVTFSAIASSQCSADTFFTVYVQDPSAAFTIDPTILCTDPAIYTFTHPESGFSRYDWYIEELDSFFTGGPEYTFTYDEPTRDSFYISRLDTFTVFLRIQTAAGCFAIDSTEFYHRAPRAHFVPDVSRGCAPLTINFDEMSVSTEDIISWDWAFGDGTTASTMTADDMTHTYDDPGEYYVKLIIENEAGCRDTSEGVWIYVGEPIDSDFTIDKTEICLRDSVRFEALNLDPRIDAWHFDTDDGRISDCYTDPGASHTFVHAPGTYPVSLTIEYNGCFNEIANGDVITVNGSKSLIKYMTNCVDPYTVMFQDSSLNATTSIWYMNGDIINMDTISGDVFNYTFDSTGNYEVVLITDDDTECPPDTSSINVYIRDIVASFELPEKVCAFAPIELDASASVDVDNTCSKGYEWFGIANRPRQIDYPVVEAVYQPGPITVRLVVEDLNGCKDTITKESEAFEIQANFEPSRDKMCFPSTISFTDLSVGDTTITNWDWSFGSMDQNPVDFEFLSNTSGGEDLVVQLKITDALGCIDSTFIEIPIYEVTSNLSANPGTIVCLGSEIDFFATDFTEEGSFLNYNWDLGVYGSSMDQNPTVTVTQAGIVPISLTVEEDDTGCQNTYDLVIQGIIPPEADFTINAPPDLCPDEIVLFTNNSVVDGPVSYLWDFGNETVSFDENPGAFFNVGTFDITLTVNSIYGCSDMHTDQITLVGPEGSFTTDKDEFCLGDSVTFTLIETNNVESFEWSFGDGNSVSNVSPITHPYVFLPDTLQGMLDVTVVLTATNGCEVAVTQAVSISDLRANFEIQIDTSDVCNKEIQLINLSEGPIEDYSWNFGDGNTSDEISPTHIYIDSGEYVIQLVVKSSAEICESTYSDTHIHTVLDTVTIPTVFSPNNDDRNDFFDIIVEEEQRECIEVVRSKIFNRWGNLIYDNDLPPEGWDGRYENGDIAPAEIYTYILEVVYSTGETAFFKGMFTLIR